MQELEKFHVNRNGLHFNNIRDAWDRLVLDIPYEGKKTSPRGLPTIELTNVALQYEGPYQYTFYNPVRKLNPVFHLAELFYFLNGRDDSLIQDYTSQMKHYFNEDTNRMDGSYGPPLRDGLPEAVAMLGIDIDSRRAVIPILNERHVRTMIKTKDYPCNISIGFSIRDKKLNMNVVTRSQDLYYGFLYDTLEFQLLQYMLASVLYLDVGVYGHYLFSLHLYEKDIDNAKAAVGITESDVGKPRYVPVGIESFWKHARDINLVLERPTVNDLVFDDISNAINNYKRRSISDYSPAGIYTTWVHKWLEDRRKDK